MRKLLQICAAWTGLALGAAQAQSEPPIADVPNPSGAVNELLAFWTQIVPGSTDPRKPLVEARFVVMADADFTPAGEALPLLPPNVGCNAIAVSGMAPGAGVQTRGALVGRFRDGAPGSYTRGKHYLVTVCAAALEPGADQVSLSLAASPGAVLPVYPDGKPAQMAGPGQLGRRNGNGLEAVFTADTGCRGSGGRKGSRSWQDCADDGVAENGSREDGRGIWPLKPMSENAAALTPDFVMHGGDHHYFYEDDGFWTQEVDKTDRFEYWLQEFLNPAQPLLLTSPFVFVRGNHESCEITINSDGKQARQWFGDGWFKMFAPPGVTGCPDHSPTWSFDIAPAGDASVPPFRFYVVDTSQTSAAFGAFDAAASDGVADKAWLAHYPAAKLVFYDPLREGQKTPNTPHVGDDAIRASIAATMQACETAKSPHCLPRFMLAGHQHLYQEVDFYTASTGALRTKVIVAGNGGTVLDYASLPQIYPNVPEDDLVECFYVYGQKPFPFGRDAMLAVIETSSRHGFLQLVRNTGAVSGWDFNPVWFPKADLPPAYPARGEPDGCAPPPG